MAQRLDAEGVKVCREGRQIGFHESKIMSTIRNT
jgi:hypothetical protein